MLIVPADTIAVINHGKHDNHSLEELIILSSDLGICDEMCVEWSLCRVNQPKQTYVAVCTYPRDKY